MKNLRYFVDQRAGCAAIRDSQHPNYNPNYQGLHFDTSDVVEYRHGFQEESNWTMKDEDIKFLKIECERLNALHTNKTEILNQTNVENKQIIDIGQVKTALEERARINKLNLTDCVFVENGIIVEIPQEVIESFQYSGLCNIDFIRSEFYKKSIEDIKEI